MPTEARRWPGSERVQPLENRAEAGRRLAERLTRYVDRAPLVLAIPRGGVPVGVEIARRLGCELDVLIVRKVGAPGDPEYGLGAVGEGDVVLVDAPRAHAAGYSPLDLESVVRREREEVAARARRFRGGRPPAPLDGRTAIVVDDGVATGGTVATAVTVVRARHPSAVVVALGVAAPEAVARLRRIADDVVVALVPPYLEAVGQWYRDFDPVEDETVQRLLGRAGPGLPSSPA